MNITTEKPIAIRTGVYGVAILDDQILVVKQKEGVHQGKFDLPGGGIEPGEMIEEALRREFKEEVGMSFETMTHLCNFTAITEHLKTSIYLHQIGLIYRVETLLKIENLDPELDFRWISLDDCSQFQLTPFLKRALQKIKNPVG